MPKRKRTKPPKWSKRDILDGVLYQLENGCNWCDLPLFTHCTKANLSDDKGLIEMLSNNIDYFKSKPVNIPKITILIDNGYHPEKLKKELEQIYPQIMSKIRFKLSPKPSKVDKNKLGKTGFVPVKARWVIERSNSWMERCIHFSQKF